MVRNSMLKVMVSGCFRVLIALAAVLGVVGDAKAQEAKPQAKPIRELFVPFDEIAPLISGANQRVFMTREEFQELQRKAQIKTLVAPPTDVAMLAAEYQIQVAQGRAEIRGSISLEVLSDGMHLVALDVAGVGILEAKLDESTAPLVFDGAVKMLVEGRGKHVLDLKMACPMLTSAAQQAIQIQLPKPASTRYSMSVPGNVEIKSGAAVLSRRVDVDANITYFEIVPPISQINVIMSLNNKTLRDQQSVVAKSVIVDEVTESYERVHVTMSMNVLHGAVEHFQFIPPVGFEVTSVENPLLSRWSLSKNGDQDVLDVQVREPVIDRTVLQITLLRSQPSIENWQWPKLTPVGVASHVSLVGLLLDERLKSGRIEKENLISVDQSILATALPSTVFAAEPGSPKIRTVAAFYAPNPEYSIQTAFTKPNDKLEIASNSILIASNQGLELRGGWSVTSTLEKLFSFSAQVPSRWTVEDIKLADGTKLDFQSYNSDQGSRIRIVFPRPIEPGQSQTVLFTAKLVPTNWLSSWQTQNLPFPKFSVEGGNTVTNAIAVQAIDDLQVEPSESPGLLALLDNEKSNFKLEKIPTSLAYRAIQDDWSLGLQFLRTPSRATAHLHTFFAVQMESIHVHSEISFEVMRAAKETFRISLPESTPSEIAIQAMDGNVLKETSSRVENGRRIWKVTLAERKTGKVRFAVDFDTRVEGDQRNDPASIALPMPRADEVVYQTGVVSIEGHPELDIAVPTHPRSVDVGELVDAEYQVGKRLLGAYSYVGTEDAMVATISKRPSLPLPSSIVQRAEFLTQLSAHGQSQTVARFLLKTRGQYLEASLPKDAMLWSVILDQKATLPQRDGDKLILELPKPSMANGYAPANDVRDLQLVFSLPIAPSNWHSDFRIPAPKLYIRNDQHEAGEEVPMADAHWELALPPHYQLVHSNGTVRWSDDPKIDLWRGGIWEKLWNWGGGFEHPLVPENGPEWFASESANLKSERMPSRALPLPKSEVPKDAIAPKLDAENAIDSLAKDLPQTAFPAPSLPEPPTSAPQVALPAPTLAPSKPRIWALEGVRSLPIDFQVAADAKRVIFDSLGDEPVLKASMVDEIVHHWLAGFVFFAIFCRGLWLIGQPLKRKVNYLFTVVALAILIPFLMPSVLLWIPLAQSAIVACIVLVMLFLVTGALGGLRIPAWFRERLGASAIGSSVVKTILAIFSFNILMQAAVGQTPSPPGNGSAVDRPEEILALMKSFAPDIPLSIPADAIVVPYDPSIPRATSKLEKILVPLETYTDLWTRANPDQAALMKPPLVPFSVQSVEYRSELLDGDSLLVVGDMEIQCWSDQEVAVPLDLRSGVLLEAKLDGASAKLRATDQGSILFIYLSKKGIKKFHFTIRFAVERQGGWRMVKGSLPSTAAAKFTLQIPKAETELRIDSIPDRPDRETTKDGEMMTVPLSLQGELALQWRPKVASGSVDQGLTVSSQMLLDVQENGLRLAWQADLQFRRGKRERFQFQLPRGYLIEKVIGSNIRGWTVAEVDQVQRLDVTLLKEASDQESMLIVATKTEPLGAAKATSVQAPLCVVPEAMLQQGVISIRRSELLEIRSEEMRGMSRTDFPADLGGLLVGIEGSPLPIRPFQAFRFSSASYGLELRATSVPERRWAEVQSIVRLSPLESRLEARIIHHAEGVRLFQTALRLPKGWVVERPQAPTGLEWSVENEGDRQRIDIRLAQGLSGAIPILIEARRRSDLAPQASGLTSEYQVELPNIEILDVVRQEGQIVVQVDPGFEVRPEQLVDCEIGAVNSTFGWMVAAQRDHAKAMIQYRKGSYAGVLRVVPQQPSINGLSITNVKVTERAIEETVYLEWRVEDAGIRQIEFSLPEWMQDAEIRAPLLRRIGKSIMSGRVQFKLELQDEIMGDYRVVIENDRPLNTGKQSVAIPQGVGASLDERFITLENAGRDEIVVGETLGMEKLDPQMKQGKWLTSLLGGKSAEAYVLREDSQNPALTFEMKDRTTVETAAARIGIARSTIIVDDTGAYRAQVELRVENRTEQYLEIELAADAKLWTVQVAGEPVKPIQSSATNAPGSPYRVRIPLVKTDAGDLDYGVDIKYGGKVDLHAIWGQIRFPVLKTININIELSQVRLMLPNSHRWYQFGGTMGQQSQQGDFEAGWIGYRTRQIEALTGLLSGKTSEFSRARAVANLKQLEQRVQVENAASFQANNSFFNKKLDAELRTNSAAIQKAQVQLQSVQGQVNDTIPVGNRENLNRLYAHQDNGRSQGVVQELQSNFDVNEVAKTSNEDFDQKWLQSNALGNPMLPQGASRVAPQQPALEGKMLGDFKNKSAAPELGYVEGAKKTKESERRTGDDTRQQARRYLQKLESQQQSETQSQQGGQNIAPNFANNGMANSSLPTMSGPGGMVGGMGGMGGMGGGMGSGGGSGGDNGIHAQLDASKLGSGEQAILNGNPTQGRVPYNNGFQSVEGYNYLRSLDVQLPNRGEVFLFSTPRGEIVLTGSGFSQFLLERVTTIAILIFGLFVAWLLQKKTAPIWSSKYFKLLFGSGLAIVGVVALLLGYLPLFACLSILSGAAMIAGSFRPVS